MIKLLRPALLLAMLAIVVISPASVYAAENVRMNTLPSSIAEGDFFSILPFYVWIIIGIILLVIIVFIIFLLFGPKKKKGDQALKPDKRGKKMPSGIDNKVKPQVQPGQPARPQQMSPDMAQASAMPVKPYMNEPSPYQQNGPAAPQMRPPQPAGTPAMSPQPVQPRPMQAPPSQAQPPQRMQPQPFQGGPQQGQQPPPMAQRPATPSPLQAQPRPVQPAPPGATGMPPRSMPQPMPPQPGQGMPPRPRPAGAPQPGFPQQRQQYAPQVPPRMDFVISNLSIVPMQVKEGDPVTISATVNNRTDSQSNYSMVFRINHVVENITEMTLGPGASQTGSITVNKENPGEYYVDVDGSRGIFKVIERAPASFSIDSLKVSPERIKQGDSIAVSFNVTNNGEKQGVYNASVNIKGISEATEDITLEGGETKHVTFNIVKDTAGFYPVSVEHLSGRFVVEMDWKG